MKKSEALKILGLSDGATDDEVKRAHRKLVIAHHPDKFPLGSKEHTDAEELTKRINEARDVLLNRSWTPEFDPRRDARPYANPYAHPTYSGTGAGRPAGQGGNTPPDPFAGWPFDQGRTTTYVWTSWDGVHTAGEGGRSAGAGANPFDGFDPFAPFYAAQPQRTPAEVLAESERNLKTEVTRVAAKAAVLVLLAVLGSAPTGLFLYVMASVILGLWKRVGSCLIGLLVPLAVVGIPFVFLIAPRQGGVTVALAVAFFIALAFDVSNLRTSIATWRAAKQAAGKATK